MTDLISKYKTVWGDDPKKLLDEYSYQRELTVKLDALKPENLDMKSFCGNSTASQAFKMICWMNSRKSEH